jgi:hypothetical protein
METKEYKGVEFKVIEPVDLAEYIEKVYNNATFREFLLSCRNKGLCEQTTNRLSDILVKYYIATGDDSDKSIETIVSSYRDNPVDMRNISGANDIKFHQFRHAAYPFIIDYWKKELGKEELSFSDIQEIMIIVSTQSYINRFDTHSFNGALKDKVESEGLNINNEMFRENYEYLSSIAGSAYSVGNLYLCNLSESSWGYMHHSPERLWMTIGSYSVTREPGETDNEFAKRNLDDVLSRYVGLYDEKYLETAKVLGDEMIDFYTKSDDVCIAICRKGRADVEAAYQRSEETITGRLNYAFQLPYKFQRAFPRELVQQLNNIAIEGDKEGRLEDIERIINEMMTASPDKADFLREYVENVFSSNMATYSVNNYMHAGASDGIRVEGGVLPREAFALATIKDPSREYDLRGVDNTKKR